MGLRLPMRLSLGVELFSWNQIVQRSARLALCTESVFWESRGEGRKGKECGDDREKRRGFD